MAKAEYRSAIRSRKLITNALVDLLDEKPIDKITVTDIVRKADINRGTFYAHYSCVADVINSLFENPFEIIKTTLKEATLDNTPNPDIMLKQLQTLFEQDIEFYRKIFSSDVSMLIYEHLTDVMISYLSEHEEEFSPISHEDYLFFIRFCSGGTIKLYQDWFSGKLPITFDELTQRVSITLNSLMDVCLRFEGR